VETVHARSTLANEVAAAIIGEGYMERLMNVPDPMTDECEGRQLGRVVGRGAQDLTIGHDGGEEARRTKCVYQQGNETFTVGKDEKVVVVNVAYLEQHAPFVRDRLKRAGIRLAHLLNTTLGQ